jgi:hypothetical protein
VRGIFPACQFPLSTSALRSLIAASTLTHARVAHGGDGSSRRQMVPNAKRRGPCPGRPDDTPGLSRRRSRVRLPSLPPGISFCCPPLWAIRLPDPRNSTLRVRSPPEIARRDPCSTVTFSQPIRACESVFCYRLSVRLSSLDLAPRTRSSFFRAMAIKGACAVDPGSRSRGA